MHLRLSPAAAGFLDFLKCCKLPNEETRMQLFELVEEVAKERGGEAAAAAAAAAAVVG